MGNQITTPAKVWYKSSTIWLNVAGGAIMLLQLGINQSVIPMQYQELALAVLNILVRFKTNQAVTLS